MQKIKQFARKLLVPLLTFGCIASLSFNCYKEKVSFLYQVISFPKMVQRIKSGWTFEIILYLGNDQFHLYSYYSVGTEFESLSFYLLF
jgi:hypothetical protein